MLKEQRFGVEVEMTGISRKKAADVLGYVVNFFSYKL